MALYTFDPNQLATGVNPLQGHFTRRMTAPFTSAIIEVGTPVGGKAWAYTADSHTAIVSSFDAVPAGTTDCEVLLLARSAGATGGVDSLAELGAVTRIDGAVGAVSGYARGLRFSDRAISRKWLGDGGGGIFTTLTHSLSYVNNGWCWIKMQSTGTAHRAKYWQNGTNEPESWVQLETDSSYTAGGCGLGGYHNPLYGALQVGWFSVGTVGDPAPSPPTTPITITWTDPTPENTSFYELEFQVDGPPAARVTPIPAPDPFHTLQGSGADIIGAVDAFHFAYQALTGDVSIVARVASLTNTDPWAKAGVMIRESLDVGSRNALVALTPERITFQRRGDANGTTVTTHALVGSVVAPHWVRLTRTGNTFTAHQSPDGNTWAQVGTAVTISMAASVYVGLALTSHENTVLATAQFNHTTVNALAPTLTGLDIGAVGVAGSTTPPDSDELSHVLSVVINNGQTLYSRTRAVYGDPPTRIYGDWSTWGTYLHQTEPPPPPPLVGFFSILPEFRFSARSNEVDAAGLPAESVAEAGSGTQSRGQSIAGVASEVIAEAVAGVSAFGQESIGTASVSLSEAVDGAQSRGQDVIGLPAVSFAEAGSGAHNQGRSILGVPSESVAEANSGAQSRGQNVLGNSSEARAEAVAGAQSRGQDVIGLPAESVAEAGSGTQSRGQSIAGVASEVIAEAVAGVSAFGQESIGTASVSLSEAVDGAQSRGQDVIGLPAESVSESPMGVFEYAYFTTWGFISALPEFRIASYWKQILVTGLPAESRADATTGTATRGFDQTGQTSISLTEALTGLAQTGGAEFFGVAAISAAEAQAGLLQVGLDATGAAVSISEAVAGELVLGFAQDGQPSIGEVEAYPGIPAHGLDLTGEAAISTTEARAGSLQAGWQSPSATAVSLSEATAGSVEFGIAPIGMPSISLAEARSGLAQIGGLDLTGEAAISAAEARTGSLQAGWQAPAAAAVSLSEATAGSVEFGIAPIGMPTVAVAEALAGSQTRGQNIVGTMVLSLSETRAGVGDIQHNTEFSGAPSISLAEAEAGFGRMGFRATGVAAVARADAHAGFGAFGTSVAFVALGTASESISEASAGIWRGGFGALGAPSVSISVALAWDALRGQNIVGSAAESKSSARAGTLALATFVLSGEGRLSIQPSGAEFAIRPFDSVFSIRKR